MADAATIAVGDVLPAFVREGTVDHWNRFAAVNYEFAAHHWDEEVAREEGFAAPFAMAPLLHAYLHAMVREWAGEDARLLSLDIRLRSPFLRGRTLTAGGAVTALRCEPGSLVVDLALQANDDQGVNLITGAASVALPA